MAKLEFAIGTIVVILLAAVFLWAFEDGLSKFWSQLPGVTSKTAERIETREGSSELAAPQARSIENIAEEFVDRYRAAIDKNDEAAAVEAKNLLSEHGRNVVETDSSPIEGLRRLVRNLPAPLRLEVTANRQQSQNFAELATRWIYPDTTLERYFYFTLEQGEWKIDSVQETQQ